VASDQLKLIDARGTLVRLLLIVLTVLALYGSWSAAYWYFGSEIAIAAPYLPENAREAAETATRLAPSDPLAHWSLATLRQRSLAIDDLQSSIADFERAVGLSPRDFRLWVDLGRAREQAGDLTGSEKALRRAVELAPFYVWPRWHLGNFLARRGRVGEGFAELRRVIESDPSKRAAVFDLAWTIYGGELAAMRDAFGDSQSVQADFAGYLLGRGRLDEALQIWSGLNAAEKKERAETLRVLVDHLIAGKRFRDALKLSNDLTAGKAEAGRIRNGSFEQPVTQNGTGLFDWRVPSVTQAQAALDPTGARDGSLSLRISFNAPGALDFHVAQLVAVEPAGHYRLSFYVRANSLKSAAMPVVQVISADGKMLAESAPAAPDKSDWQQVTMDFKMPPNLDGITLRIGRAPCTAEGGVCPIFGTVWYDDFNLQLIGR
jgi:tetratricopeptide (TPR) repeat protein